MPKKRSCRFQAIGTVDAERCVLGEYTNLETAARRIALAYQDISTNPEYDAYDEFIIVAKKSDGTETVYIPSSGNRWNFYWKERP